VKVSARGARVSGRGARGKARQNFENNKNRKAAQHQGGNHSPIHHDERGKKSPF